jgi:glycosyltransferase involved in cell wall biosynthesis
VINELSIVIPALNETGYLPQLLDSIGKQTFTGKLQVIVVDGHSADKTVAVARSFAPRIKDLEVLESERGIGHQRNVGAMQAKYGYLLFIDADVVLPPQVLEQLSSKIPATGPFVAGIMHTAKNKPPAK